MRTKLRTIALALLTLVVLVIGAFAYAVLSEKPIPEPRYQGESLSEWLAGPRAQAEVAVRSIGTNALPCLLEWFRYELPWWRKGLLTLATQPVPGKPMYEGKIVYGRSLIIGPTARRAELADLGFVILSTNAVPAIPELQALMTNNQKPDMSLRAIYALGEIGDPAIPALTNALADTNQVNRGRIVEAIYAVELKSPSYSGGNYKGACLPALIRALDDPNEWVRRQATNTLHNLDHHKEILARLRYGDTFREHFLQARTNALPKTAPEIFTNTPAK